MKVVILLYSTHLAGAVEKENIYLMWNWHIIKLTSIHDELLLNRRKEDNLF